MLKKKSSLKKVNHSAHKKRISSKDTAKHLHKEKVPSSEKIRLIISCTEDEKMYIKMLAAKEKKTISDYLLTFARSKMPKPQCGMPGCSGIHKPNKLTEKVLRESERGENLEHHDTVEDFWESMGIDPNA